MNRHIARYLLYYPVTIARGEFVHRHLKAYEAFQWYQPEEIANYQVQGLRQLVQFARDNVPLYRETFAAAGVQGRDLNSLADIRCLPTVCKEDLRKSQERLTCARYRRTATRKTTGGSTGEAVTVLKNADALARERAATWRSYKWAGVDIGDSQARLWGIPLRQRESLASKVIDFVANRKRLSAFGIDDAVFQRYYEQIRRFKPVYFYGYVSMMVRFADFLDGHGYALPANLKCVITTSEVLDRESRRRIESAFRCRVYNEYGCGEVGSIAHECEYGNMHVMEDNLVIEIDSSGFSGGEAGEVIVTDLHNRAMPLIRYRLKDFATANGEGCGCGRGLRVIGGIHGRAYDLLHGPDGKVYHPELIMYMFEDLKKRGVGVRQFQVVQKPGARLNVILVSPSASREETEKLIREEFRRRFGSMFVLEFSYQEEIQREPSGKIRLVKGVIEDDPGAIPGADART